MIRLSSIQRNPSGFAIKDKWIRSVSSWPHVLGIVDDVLSSELWWPLWNSQWRIIFHQEMRFRKENCWRLFRKMCASWMLAGTPRRSLGSWKVNRITSFLPHNLGKYKQRLIYKGKKNLRMKTLLRLALSGKILKWCYLGSWGDGSAVQSTCYSYRSPGFGSQNPNDSLTVTPFPG